MSEGKFSGLKELVEGTTEEVSRRLFKITAAIAAANDPPLGELLDLGAIPEALDVETIGILRARPEDDETNRRLFDALKSYPFVEVYEDGTVGYHDVLRPALQQKFRNERPDEFTTINQRLGTFYLEHGRSCYKRGDFSGALLSFRRAIATEYASVSRAYRWRGRTYAKLYQFSEAVDDFSTTIMFEPEHSENYFRRASAYLELGRYPDAIADLDRAIQLEPVKYPKNYFARGMAYYRLGNNEQALADFDQAVAAITAIPEATIQPEEQRERASFDEVLEGRGIVLMDLRRYEQALRDFEQARLLNPQSNNHWFWCGLASYHLGQYQQAINHLSEAIHLHSSDDLAFRWRGVALTKLGDYTKAKQDFLEALEIDPRKSINYYWIGFAQFHLKEYNAALVSFNQAITLSPQFYPAYRWRGTLLYGLGVEEQARSDFDTAIAGLPRNVKIYEERGSYIFLNTLHDLARAEQDFNTALSLNPSPAEQGSILFWRSQVYLEQGAFQKALGDLTAAINYQPTRSRNWFWRGVVYDTLGQSLDAKHDWQQTRELVENESNPWTRRTRLAWLALLHGSVAEAHDYYLQAFTEIAHYLLYDLRYQLSNLQRLSRTYPQRSDIAAFVGWYAQVMETHLPPAPPLY